MVHGSTPVLGRQLHQRDLPLGLLTGITVGTQRQSQKTGRRILDELRKFTKGAIRDWQRAERKRILRELESIKNFDTLVARTTDHRGEMSDRIRQLENELQSARDALAQATGGLLALKENDTREVDRGCLELLASLAFKRAERCVAGPLALWDDGVVYVITQIGRVNLPEPSTYAWLLRQLEASSVQVVKVKEMTILGGRASGPSISLAEPGLRSGLTSGERGIDPYRDCQVLAEEPGPENSSWIHPSTRSG